MSGASATPASTRPAPARTPATRDLLGASLLILAWVFFTTEMVNVRILSDDLSTAQIAIIRTGTQAILLLPLLLITRGRAMRTKRLPMHVLRSAFSQGGMVLFYVAFSLLPLALATTLTFTQASFITILAALFLGERIGWRRISAVALGFLGVLVVMRPGFGGFEPAMLVALFGALVAASLMIVTRTLSQTDGPFTIMLYSAWLGLAWMAIPAALTYQPIAAEHWPHLALLALAGTLGQFLMVCAFQMAEASTLAPVDYVRLIFAVAAGYAVFGELPDVWTYVGSAIVCASVGIIIVRSRAPSASAAPEVPPPGAPRQSPPPATNRAPERRAT